MPRNPELRHCLSLLWVRMDVLWRVWQLEDNFMELVLSFHLYACSQDSTRLVWHMLDPLNHLSGPQGLLLVLKHRTENRGRRITGMRPTGGWHSKILAPNKQIHLSSFAFCCCNKNTDQKQLTMSGEKGVDLAYTSMFNMESISNQGRNWGRDYREAAYQIALQALISHISQDHQPRGWYHPQWAGTSYINH